MIKRHIAKTMSKPVVEGVFAINKPQGLSSAQVVRDVQAVLGGSRMYAEHLAAEKRARGRENERQRRRRRSKKIEVKIGHGGTLDPLATGVLILGIGQGTKQLHYFLGACRKQYETTVLFGAATDTYDILGKVLQRETPGPDVTRARVEAALDNFRGQIMQTPPIYSALKVQGKKLYEFARKGEQPPIEIVPRPVQVHELDLIEWLEPGTHNLLLPAAEAGDEEKQVATSLLHLKKTPDSEPTPQPSGVEDQRAKLPSTEPTTAADSSAPDAEVAQESTSAPVASSPLAARIRLTVGSGFYVRSFAHDLGRAVDSLGCMGSLVRTRQAAYELGQNVIPYEELQKEEIVWAPRLEQMLQQWQSEEGPNMAAAAAAAGAKASAGSAPVGEAT